MERIFRFWLAHSSLGNFRNYSQTCNKPVWVTEVGTESSSTTWAATETAQSSFLTSSFQLFQSLGAKAYLWYELSDAANGGSYFGLFDGNGNLKQAFTTYSNLVNGVSTSPTPTATSPQNPTATPTSSSHPSASPSQLNATPRSVPEMNETAVLAAMVTIACMVPSALYIKKRVLKKH